ncbi:multicopper oxidase family protein [Streptacidiphilus rugosus]|uniref:multicopper oxidase family protein n=1 Tax=Streptacidiphilus rugosus TaxID=405783 RepID=UPI0006911EC2|nr:multicopper oxidase domain-containing protein [Streptacidiphilus rugosus]
MPAPTGPTPPRLTKFLDPLRIPTVLRPRPGDTRPQLTVRLTSARQRLHAQLPPTPLWTYGGEFPGPTLELRRGRRLRVTWTNEIDTPFPVVEGNVPESAPPAENEPGIDPGGVDKAAAGLPAWTVTHLHGARTGGGNDGWTENAVLPGESQLSEYPNDQPATALWYHDHAMGITRLNVQAGLAGMYLVRDEEEDALGLPGGAYEIPLVLCDRNLALGDDGAFTGELLHKTAGPLPFFGPYTLVNGVIWPYLEVRARWYRFRVLNASNARTYRLHLVDEGTGERVPDAVWQIGTDAGLLGAPIPLPDGGLALAPAERADLLVDFGALGARTLRLVDSAPEPYAAVPLAAGAPVGVPRPDQRLPEPDVLQFRVADEPPASTFTLPPRLAASYARLHHDRLPEPHMHRMLVLAPNRQGSFRLWEMEEVPHSALAAATDGVVQTLGADGVLRTYRRLSQEFDETLNWHVRQDGWEVWTILNLSVALHPVHLHLIRFQALARESWDVSGFRQSVGGTAPGAPVGYRSTLEVAPSDQGWKDVIQVPPGQLVRIGGQFSGSTGRYMYHCHLLEHEDDGMMRPFTVSPGPVLDLQGGGMPMPM